MTHTHKYKICNFSNFLGKFLVCTTYVIIIFQLYTIYRIEEDAKSKGKTYLYFFKYALYISTFFSILSHVQASLTDPGKIEHSNNIDYLDFYAVTRTVAVKKAEMFNNAVKHLLRPPIEEDDDEYSDWENDDYAYEKSEIFTEEKVEVLNKKLGFGFRLCKKCDVCRFPGTHHCSDCRGCIYQMDHHCPWLNNCVGQFNQKYFILFCSYSLIGSLLGAYISIYYVAIKQPLRFIENIYFAVQLIIQMVVSICSIFLFARLLFDQYINVKDNLYYYDMEKNKMIEKRNVPEILFEIFGGFPSLWWILPFRRGGSYNRLKEVKKGK